MLGASPVISAGSGLGRVAAVVPCCNVAFEHTKALASPAVATVIPVSVDMASYELGSSVAMATGSSTVNVNSLLHIESHCPKEYVMTSSALGAPTTSVVGADPGSSV